MIPRSAQRNPTWKAWSARGGTNAPGAPEYRNGCQECTLDTRLGLLQLCVPKLRQGSYFSPFLEPKRVSERTLVAVIQEVMAGAHASTVSVLP